MLTLKHNDLKTISLNGNLLKWHLWPATKWPFLLLSIFWKPCTRSFQSCCRMQNLASAGGSFLMKHEVILRQTESRVVWNSTITLTGKCFVFSHLLFLSVWCFSLPFPPYGCDSLALMTLDELAACQSGCLRVMWLYVCLRKEMILFKECKGRGGSGAHMRFQNNTGMRALEKHTTEK